MLSGLTGHAGKDDKELELSDLEDFDPLDAETSECELKTPFQSLDSGPERIFGLLWKSIWSPNFGCSDSVMGAVSTAHG